MISYSRVSTYIQCPKKYKLRYVDKLKTFFDCQAANPLTIGNLLHRTVEKGFVKARQEYLDEYPVITEALVDELEKARVLGRKVRKVVPKGEFERKISIGGFIGFIDLLVETSPGVYDLYDFKYSNNKDHYLGSPQLSVYKYFFEKQTGFAVDRLFYVMCPKTQIRQKKTEDLYHFRERLISQLESMEPEVCKVEFSQEAVTNFLASSIEMLTAQEFPACESRLCKWCEYAGYCMEGEDIMILPENKRRKEEIITDPDMWIYADSYVGKSTFVDHFDDVLFINTDGNTQNITSPFIQIADELVHEGRMTKKVLAWAKFRDVIDELEKHENTFKVIALDLVEDLYEHCRFYVFDQLGIKHESDGGYGKGWDMVRTEFLSQMKRLKSLGYRIIYISKELVTEITYANGMKVSTFKPNIPDKVANVLAGTVTMTLRAYMDERGHFLQLRKNENVFGGGRIDFKQDRCDLTVEAFNEALLAAQGGEAKPATKKPEPELEPQPVVEEEPEQPELPFEPGTAEEPAPEPEPEEKPKRRVRKRRVAEEQ